MKYYHWTLLALIFTSSCSVLTIHKENIGNARSLANIPTHNTPPCRELFFKVISRPSPENAISFLDKGMKAVSAYDFADLLAGGLKNNIDDDTFLEVLIRSPFYKEMGITLPQVNELVSIIKNNKVAEVADIIDIMENYFKPYMRRAKKVTRVRDYDQALESLKIENQCNFNSCWTFASVGKLEHTFMKKLGRPIDLSEDYFYARYILNEIRSLYRRSFIPIGPLISERGSASAFNALIPHFGIIPKSAFSPRKAFSGTERDAFLQELREAVLRHMEAMAKVKSDINAQEELLSAIDNEVKSIIAKYVDDLDKEFIHEGVTYNAQTYYEKIIGEPNKAIKRFIRDTPEEEVKYVEQQEAHIVRDAKGEVSNSVVDVKNAAISDKDIEDLIIFSINNDEPLFFAFRAPGENILSGLQFVSLINKTTGKASLKDSLGNTIDDIEGTNPHAVLITGYELDLRGRIKTIKIQNSSGTEYGDEGIIHMDSDFFWKYYMWITKS